MNREQPKKYIIPIKFKDNYTGFDQRSTYGAEILYKKAGFPLPLLYEDIDNAFKNFVDNELSLTDEEGNKVPTFTLYSNQRFSEYSQTWRHVDVNGNLLMNFKTINRDNNPKGGTNQANFWNIPGDRFYTLFKKDVLEDNGQETVEVYSIKQPYAVDLYYKINFITNVFENLNKFNVLLNNLFKARQCYIRPNGHFIPMILEEVNDDTTYTIEDRKFFVQSVGIKALAYIIRNEDMKLSKYPKNVKIYGVEDKTIKTPTVEVEEYEKNRQKVVDIIISYRPYTNKVEFVMDENVSVIEIITENVRNYRIFVEETPCFGDKVFNINNKNTVKVKIKPVEYEKPSKIILRTESRDFSYAEEGVLEDVSREKEKYNKIFVEKK